MASRRELLDSISYDMRFDKSFFMKIYGYELTWAGFAEDALTRLEFLGCSRAREYYYHFVSEYEKEHEKQMKNVAKWYRDQCEKESRKVESECKEKRREINNYKSNLKSNFFLISKELDFQLDSEG